MNQNTRCVLGAAVGMAVAALCLALVFPPFNMIFLDAISDILVSDHSAEWRGQDTIYWDGSYYDYCGAPCEYREGKTIAKTSDCDWDINEVEGDPSHTYIVVRSFLDQYLFVKRDVFAASTLFKEVNAS